MGIGQVVNKKWCHLQGKIMKKGDVIIFFFMMSYIPFSGGGWWENKILFTLHFLLRQTYEITRKQCRDKYIFSVGLLE